MTSGYQFYGKGIRISSRHESQQLIQEVFPGFAEYYQKVAAEQDHRPGQVSDFKKLSIEAAFGTPGIEFDNLF